MKQSGVVKKQWYIRKYREGDEKQILELRGATLGDSKDVRWWNWIYRNGPDGSAYLNLAVTKQKIIGIASGLPLRIKIGEQVCKSILGFDIMTHPDYQRQGILSTLDNIWIEYLVKNGINMDHGTSTVQRFPVYQKLRVSHGYNHFIVYAPPLLVKVINWGRVLKTHWKIPTFIGALFGYVWEGITCRRLSLQKGDIEVEQISYFDESFNDFWLRSCNIKKIIFVRDMKYLNWRYVEKPGNEYKIFVAKSQKEIVGYIVVMLEKNNVGRGFIVDLLTLPSEDVAAEVLISGAIEYLRGEGAAMISCLMIKDTPYYRILRKLGFLHRHSGIQLNVRIFDQNLSKEFVADPSNWYFVWGDTDTK